MGETTRIDSSKESLFTHVKDGIKSRMEKSSHIRTGGGYVVVYGHKQAEANDDIVSVRGNGLNLVPLDHANYPGVFINTPSKAHLDSSHDDDIRITPSFSTTATDRSAALPKITHQQRKKCATGVRHYFEIAMAYDHTFCDLYSGNAEIANAMVQSMIDESNIAYKRDTCIELVLVHIESNCQATTDPYRDIGDFPNFRPCRRVSFPESCSPSDYILNTFAVFWKANRDDIKRDAAYLLTGFEFEVFDLGIAFIEGACSKKYGYGWVEGPIVLTFAHEIGHTLSDTHTGKGIMVGRGFEESRFSPKSVDQITKYVDGRETSCISTDDPMCDAATCPGGCDDDNKCVRGKAVPSGLVPCKSTMAAYYCVEGRLGFMVGVDCPSNYNYVQVAEDANDPTIFCCSMPTSTVPHEVYPRTRPLLLKRVYFRKKGVRRTQLFDNWLGKDGDSFVTRETLMESTLVADCADPGPATPTPTLVSPTPTPSASASPTRETCGGTFKQGSTFKCVRRKSIGRFRTRIIAPVTLFISQGSVVFTTFLQTAVSARVMNFGRVISTDGSLNAKDVVAPAVVNPASRPLLEQSTNPFTLFLPFGEDTCCLKRVYVYVKIKVCSARTGDCELWARKLSYRMACTKPCRRGGGKVVPFSFSEMCPYCD